MNGPDCPIHGTPMDWLATTNEWEYACRACDRRYNVELEPMPPLETLHTLRSRDAAWREQPWYARMVGQTKERP